MIRYTRTRAHRNPINGGSILDTIKHRFQRLYDQRIIITDSNGHTIIETNTIILILIMIFGQVLFLAGLFAVIIGYRRFHIDRW